MTLLIIERGPNAGQRITLAQFPVTVGRDPTNTIVIDDEEVSRYHLRIKQRGRLFIAEDLESKNGTFVNGDRILNSIVQNGDKILVGSIEFQFVTSVSDIQLATEILNFDMVLSDDLGIKGPIEVGKHDDDRRFAPLRINAQSVVNQHTDDLRSIKEVYDLSGNILVIEDLEEGARTLLKGLGKLMPSASRAAVFVWHSAGRQLIPCATRQYKRKKEQFLLSQRSLEDALTRKQGVLLPADSPQATQSGRTRLVLPMIHNDEPICVLHIESDDPRHPFTAKEIELVQALISRCAPSFETMLLRREIDGWMVGMIETMVAMIEAKDTYTHGHSERVSRYSMAIADELKLNREVKRLLLVSALCHDVGKVGIPDAILKKASMLSSEEYEEMKLHPTIGAEIIRHMPNAHRFISGVKHHHEKWDGTGYPDGLAGEDIPFFGRIVALADVFDAMVSGRAYSGFMDQGDAMTRIVEEAELFDPEILKAVVRAHDSGALTLKTSTASNRPGAESGGAEKADEQNAKPVRDDDDPPPTAVPVRLGNVRSGRAKQASKKKKS
jgi:HD-GYP domain-containing protein (c-di-GMP phosphodiesterase class II)